MINVLWYSRTAGFGRREIEYDENGVRYISHTQTAYTVEMYETFKEYMPTGYKVTTPFPADTDARISLLNKDGTCNRPDAAVQSSHLP